MPWLTNSIYCILYLRVLSHLGVLGLKRKDPSIYANQGGKIDILLNKGSEATNTYIFFCLAKLEQNQVYSDSLELMVNILGISKAMVA